jgi:DNA (cytosine-5)-methyltransferase 1
MAHMNIGVVDLFCGIGGLSYGFKSEGLNVLAGIDSDPSCKYSFETNVKAIFLPTDVAQVSGRQLAQLFARRKTTYRVLVGCAPCPPFSIYTGRYRKEKRPDARWQLLKEFARLVQATKPDVVSMENVPRITRHPVFSDFVADLEAAGYTVTYRKVRADHYGVAQRRARLVLFASLWGEVKLPPQTHRNQPVTVRDVIGGLPRIEAGESCPSDRLHAARGLSPKNMARIKATVEGGAWEDWDQDLQLACHKRQEGRSFRSVYGRMRWDAPSPVITTQCLGIGNGRFGHPDQDRAISIREAALLQSFPRKFRFVPPGAPVNGAELARQIGNAVPIKLSRIIARAIKRHLSDVSKLAGGGEAAGRSKKRR